MAGNVYIHRKQPCHARLHRNDRPRHGDHPQHQRLHERDADIACRAACDCHRRRRVGWPSGGGRFRRPIRQREPAVSLDRRLRRNPVAGGRRRRAALSCRPRRASRHPLSTLVGLNIARVLGALFILLAWSGRLGGPFPQSAGWGDVVTGLLAVPVMGLAAGQSALRDRAIWLWNALGTLDLLSAVALGVTSANGSPLQLIHAGPGSAAVQVLPWALIPSVLVPFYLITHGIIFAQLRARSANAAHAADQTAHSWALNHR